MQWLGQRTNSGGAIFISAEDDEAELQAEGPQIPEGVKALPLVSKHALNAGLLDAIMG